MRVIRENQLQDCLSGLEDPDCVGVDFHPLHTGSGARRSEIASSGDLDDAKAAGGWMVVHAGAFKVDVAQCGNLNATCLGCVKDGGALFDRNGTVVYGKVYLVLIHGIMLFE